MSYIEQDLEYDAETDYNSEDDFDDNDENLELNDDKKYDEDDLKTNIDKLPTELKDIIVNQVKDTIRLEHSKKFKKSLDLINSLPYETDGNYSRIQNREGEKYKDITYEYTFIDGDFYEGLDSDYNSDIDFEENIELYDYSTGPGLKIYRVTRYQETIMAVIETKKGIAHYGYNIW